MGLFTTYDDRNKNTHNGLAIRYSVTPEYRDVHLSSGTMTTKYYKVSRYATKSYSYVGMDQTTARQCAQAKQSQYYRNYSIISINDEGAMDSEYTKECQSDISYVHESGLMWRCDINVNETDVKAANEIPANPASMFTAENNRNYDEDSGATSQSLNLNSVTRASSQSGVTTVGYTQQIQGFNQDSLMLQYKVGTSASWQSAAKVSGGYTGLPVSGTIFCRLIYGSLESNTLEVS